MSALLLRVPPLDMIPLCVIRRVMSNTGTHIAIVPTVRQLGRKRQTASIVAKIMCNYDYASILQLNGAIVVDPGGIYPPKLSKFDLFFCIVSLFLAIFSQYPQC